MPSYFGSGYLWNLLRRGASPMANSRQAIAPVPARAEPTFAITDNPALEVHGESIDLPPQATTPARVSLDESPDVDAMKTAATPSRAAAKASNLAPETITTEVAVAPPTPAEQHSTL